MENQKTLKMNRIVRTSCTLLAVALFGSAARGSKTLASDVDLAVEIEEAAGIDLFRFAAINEMLRVMLGVNVDIVVEPARNARVQAEIDRDRMRGIGPLDLVGDGNAHRALLAWAMGLPACRTKEDGRGREIQGLFEVRALTAGPSGPWGFKSITQWDLWTSPATRCDAAGLQRALIGSERRLRCCRRRE